MRKLYILFFVFSFCILGVYSQDDDCIVDSGVELIPGPTPDPLFTGFSTYPANTVVQMCYTVEEYNTPNTQNWMHGIIPLFGPGWDLSTLQPVGQPETQFWAGGEWIWVDEMVAGVTGELLPGPGWFFDAGSGGGTLDGDPSDNWGDGNNGPWEFCWEISTQSCPPAFNEASLIVEILNYADSETGSWNNSTALNQCIDDPSYYIQALQLDCPTCDESGLTVINPTCANVDETGGVVVVTPEGIGPWNYIWFNLTTGQIIEENNNVTLPVTVSGLDPAEYLIQVEDLGFPGGCSSPVYFDILVPEEIVVEFDVIDANCVDSNDGSISISSIVNSNCVDEDLIAEDSNTDGVIDNDDFSCPSTADEVCGCDFVTYFNACQAENWYGISAYDLGECPETNSDYSISWISDNEITGSGVDINNLAVGDYQVLIECLDNTSPVFGCDFETTLTVGSPAEFVYDFSVSNVSCFVDENQDGVNDISDGSVTISLSGGTQDYTTSVGFDSGLILDTQSGENITFSDLSAGDYFFSSFDFFGCLIDGDEVFFSISEPEPLVNQSVVVSDYSNFGVSCNGGADGFINIDITGGTPPYSFDWSNNSSNQNLTNASAGTYSVIVSDQNDCVLELTDLVLTDPTVVNIVATTITPVSCFGFSDGVINIDVSGGIPPYSFSWSSDGQFLSSNPNISNLTTGEYIVSVTDSNDCEYQEVFNVGTPSLITIDENVADISCFEANDGSIDISVSGGTAPYTYLWSTLDDFEDVNSLSPGFYELTVTDSENCVQSAMYEVVEPDLLTATVQSFDVDCFGDNTGSAITSINGGTPPYNENWSSGGNPNSLFAGTYDVTVSDANGCIFIVSDVLINQPDEELDLDANVIDVFPCNGYLTGNIEPVGTGGTPPYLYSIDGASNFNNLGAGTYTVFVEDSNGCVEQNDFTVDEPSAVSASINITDASCFGLNDGEATATPSGGTAPYTLTWTSVLTGGVVDNNNLLAGSYLLNVVDDLGCFYNQAFTINEPSSSELQIVVEGSPKCLEPFDITVVSAGGVSGSWSGTGPGTMVFENQFNIATTVTVYEYGVYELVFTDDCGEQTFLNVPMNSIAPYASASPDIVYCEPFRTFLEASSESDEGVWTLLEAPENTSVDFVDGVNSFNTEIIMSDAGGSEECCYGEYLFSFSSCGGQDFVSLSIQKDAPEFGYAPHEECALDGQLFIYNPISFTDALLDPGDWQYGQENSDGEWSEIIDVVDIYYETPHEVHFSVPDYGFYEFRYFICDTFYQEFVGFSCPIEIPNVFTPNGDLNNDFLTGRGFVQGVHEGINFTIYNKWGQIVHSQSKIDYPNNVLWDGTTNEFSDEELTDGVYFYLLELTNTASQKKETYNGYIHLFRGSN